MLSTAPLAASARSTAPTTAPFDDVVSAPGSSRMLEMSRAPNSVSHPGNDARSKRGVRSRVLRAPPLVDPGEVAGDQRRVLGEPAGPVVRDRVDHVHLVAQHGVGAVRRGLVGTAPAEGNGADGKGTAGTAENGAAGAGALGRSAANATTRTSPTTRTRTRRTGSGTVMC